MIFVLLSYAAFVLFLLVVAAGYELAWWWHGRDPLERVFGQELDEVRGLPERREQTR